MLPLVLDEDIRVWSSCIADVCFLFECVKKLPYRAVNCRGGDIRVVLACLVGRVLVFTDALSASSSITSIAKSRTKRGSPVPCVSVTHWRQIVEDAPVFLDH